MATAKQIEANRQNAKKSPGPRTDEGKSRVALNALKHGLLAQRVVLPNEDEAEFAEFSLGLGQELQPVGELEEFFVSLIAACAWRLRRLMRVEKGLFSEYVYENTRLGAVQHQNEAKKDSVVSVQLVNYESVDGAVKAAQKRTEEAEERAREAEARAEEAERLVEQMGGIGAADDARMGRAFMTDGRKTDAFSRLSRYEAHIQRSMFKALDELQRLQAARSHTTSRA